MDIPKTLMIDELKRQCIEEVEKAEDSGELNFLRLHVQKNRNVGLYNMYTLIC